MSPPSDVPYRDAASVHVRLPPDRVEQRLHDARVLASVEDGFEGEILSVKGSDRTVRVADREGHVRVRLRLLEEGEGTRVAAERDVHPEGPLEAIKHMMFPGRTHEELEEGLDRLRDVMEALDQGDA